MEFKYSKDKKILKRIEDLNKFRKIYLLIQILIVINGGLLGFLYQFNAIYIFLVLLFLILVNVLVYFGFVLKLLKESLERELNPELFLNMCIWLLKNEYKRGQKCYSALLDISYAYILDGKYDKAEKILNSLEKEPLKKYNKAFFLFRKIELYFYKKDYKKIKRIEKELMHEIKNIPKAERQELLFELEMINGISNKDIPKLKQIRKRLEKSNKNIDRVYYLYIMSLFFEEGDNKYQKMLAFEGGNFFISRVEYEDQNISTKNNMKPNKHKFAKIIQILLIISQICLLISSILTIF